MKPIFLSVVALAILFAPPGLASAAAAVNPLETSPYLWPDPEQQAAVTGHLSIASCVASRARSEESGRWSRTIDTASTS